MSFENMIGQEEQTGLESSTSDYSGFPLIMWLNGDPGAVKMGLTALEYVGGWFTAPWYRHGDNITQRIPDGADKADYVEIDLSGMGWRKDYFSNALGNQVNGWYTMGLEAAFICARERWIVYSEIDGKDSQLSFTKYNDAVKVGPPRGNQQVLSIVKGMEELGPVVISLKGYAMKGFKGQGELMTTGVMSNLKKHVTEAAGVKLSGDPKKPKHINYRSVWAPVGPLISDGKPQFIKAGSGDKSKLIVTPSYLGVKYDAETIALDTVYVGDAINTLTAKIFDDNKEWATAWSNLNGEHDAPETPAEKAAVKEAENLTELASSAGL